MAQLIKTLLTPLETFYVECISSGHEKEIGTL